MATMSENNKEMTTVQASGPNNPPTIPVMNAIGKNTATVVIVDDVMAVATSLVLPLPTFHYDPLQLLLV